MIRLLLLLLAMASQFTAAASEDLSVFAFDQRPGALLPLEAQLADEAGRPVTLRQLQGDGPTVLALGYFNCPNLCGIVRDDLFSALSRASLQAPEEYNLVALSIDPSEQPEDAARAKAEDLLRYPTPGGGAGWHFLTGRAEELAAIEQAVGFRARFDPVQKQFLHPAGLVFLTPAGTVSSYLLGLGYEPAELRTALSRAAEGRVNQEAIPVLLLCFHYDAATGRYSLAIMKVLRLAAALTVMVILGMLYVAHRRKRRA